MRIKDFLKSGHPPTLLASFFYFDVSFMVWVLIGVLGVYISKDFGLTATQKGLMVALPILGGSAVRIPLGILVDRIGPKKTGIIAQLLVLFPLAGMWLWAPDMNSVLCLGVLLGIAGGSFAVALPLASRWYPAKHQGMALGIAGAGNSGTVLASLFAPTLAEHFGWRNVFGLALIPVTLVLITFILMAKESPDQPKAKKMAAYFSVFKEADTFWFCFFYGITFGGFVGLASYLGIFYHDQFGLSKVFAGNLTALCVFAGSFARPIGGYLADRFRGVTVLSVLFGVVAALMLAVSFLPPLATTVMLIFLSMACLGMGNGAVFQIVPLRFQKEIGVMTGVVGAAGGLGGFFLPTLLGYFKDRAGSYGVGFTVYAAASVIALLVLRIVKRSWAFSSRNAHLALSNPQPEMILQKNDR